MKKIAASIAVLVLAFALLAGQAALAQPGAEASRSRTVDISNFEFHPGKLEVAKGTTVVFSNSSNTAHTATDKGAFDTGRIKAGSSVAVRFTQKGTFSYHCKIHTFMHGKIVVG